LSVAVDLEFMKKRKSRLIVNKGDENIALRLEDIAFIYREGSLVFVIDKEQKKFRSNQNLSQLINELDSDFFFRVNRKYIVNFNFIKSFKTFEKVKLIINLTIPVLHHQIIVSQETSPIFKKWVSGET
jgi:DNA-binding LytR/AlgR family response regulator